MVPVRETEWEETESGEAGRDFQRRDGQLLGCKAGFTNAVQAVIFQGT